VEARYQHPEPVPAATQLAVMPFLAAMHGAIGSDTPGLRMTIHRIMNREGQGYLQQVSGYFPISHPADWRKTAGRVFPVSTGIIGKTHETQNIWRTRHFATEEELLDNLKKSMAETNDGRELAKVAKAYLAVPFLSSEGEVVLILYADCNEINFFAEDNRIGRIVAMCSGFCRLFDALQTDPFPQLRNFPLRSGHPVVDMPTVYLPLQESVQFEPPRFEFLSSFNYEASVA